MNSRFAIGIILLFLQQLPFAWLLVTKVRKTGYPSRFIGTTFRARNNRETEDGSINDMKLDLSKLSKEEQERIAFIQKLTKEANQFAKDAGFPVEDDDDELDKVELQKVPVINTKWSGQSDMEEVIISKKNPTDILNRPFLFSGDLLAFLSFSAIGRGNHGEDVGIIPILETAAPFILTWLVFSSFLGAYTREATAKQGIKIVLGILPAWIVSVPSALAIRGYIKDYIPPTPFIIVSFVATFALLFLWRTLYVSATGETTDDEYRKAGFLEVFKMVATLVRRW